MHGHEICKVTTVSFTLAPSPDLGLWLFNKMLLNVLREPLRMNFNHYSFHLTLHPVSSTFQFTPAKA